jgi:hypothetical protein
MQASQQLPSVKMDGALGTGGPLLPPPVGPNSGNNGMNGSVLRPPSQLSSFQMGSNSGLSAMILHLFFF